MYSNDMKMKQVKQLYNDINSLCFNDELLPCKIRKTRNTRALAYFHIRRSIPIIEININLIIHYEYSVIEILLHEMLHFWQCINDLESDDTDHNKNFIDSMYKLCNTLNIEPLHTREAYP